jgi:hypothetical protein
MEGFESIFAGEHPDIINNKNKKIPRPLRHIFILLPFVMGGFTP